MRIRYEYHPSPRGKGVLVLAHGLGLTLEEWDWILPCLNDEYHILRYDLRGHGQSEAGSDPFSFDRLGKDLLDLVDYLEIPEFHFIGDSLGGKIGVYMALSHPTRIRSLVLNTVPSYIPPFVRPIVLNHFKGLLSTGSMESLAEEVIPRLCYPVTEKKETKLSAMISSTTPDSYAASLRLLMESLPMERLKQFPAPSLSLWGEFDPYIPHSIASVFFSDLLPGSRFLLVPNASHAIFLDQPHTVARWIKQFIGRPHKPAQPKPSENEWFEQVRARMTGIIDYCQHTFTSVNVINVELMTTFRVFVNGEEVSKGWNQRNAKRLFIYLLFHRTVTREQLCDAFWGWLDLKNARNHLRVSLNHLKKMLSSDDSGEVPFLMIDREQVSLKGTIDCDLQKWMKRLQRAADEKDIQIKKKVCEGFLDQVGHSFLPGLYDDWILDLKGQIEGQLVSLLCSVTDQLKQEGSRSQAMSLLKKARRIFEDNEELLKQAT
ncbi:alpha/beta fold hydrolase [Salinithrix halophila]|uniref:Alpha/beta fold hydrolase n=1 Tax=Salinithrix halophila TaxID=1485204 RepID=A0ABV8JGM9_9BACL